MRVVLTIAGSDPIAGAGLQADLKTFAALGVYGTSAVTAVTSQNTAGVRHVFALPPDVVRSQIECVMQDAAVSAVKTGMLATADIVTVVAGTLALLKCRNLVVDPVMVASGPGSRTLLAPEAVSVLKAQLLPLASVVTPNLDEAGVLAGMAVGSLDTAREAARKILDLGPRAVVVKGGHLAGAQAIDLLYDGQTFTEFSAARQSTGEVHGTGCAFASALAAGLALGDDPASAVDRAKRYVTGAIQHAVAVGHGAAVLDHFWNYTRKRRAGPFGPAARNMQAIAVTSDSLDLDALIRLVADSGGFGGVSTFLGIVRDHNQDRRVTHLEYEAYEPLATKALEQIRREAETEWPGARIGVHHRVGRLAVGDASIVIAAASAHRAEAFAACRYVIERVKQIVPIWKHEFFEGGEVWIEGATANPSDEAARLEAVRRACA